MLTPLEVLKRHWGYDAFRPMQAEIIDSVLAGNDTLGLMATGGGKSITFQVPALIVGGLTLVVTPLVSLMKDQVDNLRSHDIDAFFIHAALSRREQQLIFDKCRLGYGHLLYVSPEKLQSENFRRLLPQLPIRLIVVDEAHCISQWGYDFRPSYLCIADVRREFPDAPVLALTASATPEVAADIRSKLQFREGHATHRLTFHRSNLSYVVRNSENKDAQLLHILQRVGGTAIVYVRSRKRAALTAEFLAANGLSANYYHAGLSAEEKNQRQNLWKSGETRIMVATTAFGMGIDKADVRLVVHVDPPSSLEEYYQEAGRAGRDGLESFAVSIVNPRSDKATLTKRLSNSFPPKEYLRDVYSKLCVFLNIAMGEGYQHLYEFDLSKFCIRYSLQAAMAQSALGLLSQAGYINYVEEVSTRSRLMVIMTRNELYNLRLPDECERVFQLILRTYTGIFADYEYISESYLAHTLDLTERTIYENLLLLGRLHVIHYVPHSSTPYVMLLSTRQPGRDLIFPRAIYEERRSRMAQRIEAMKQFLFDDRQCRSLTLLHYFGEQAACSCGKCDICRGRKTAVKPDDESLANRVMQILSSMPGGATAQQLGRAMDMRPERLTATLRRLADRGSITLSPTGIANKSD